MAVASLVGCTWCLDFDYFQAHNENLDLEKAREVPRWRESDVFTPLERDVMAYAEAMSQTPPSWPVRGVAYPVPVCECHVAISGSVLRRTPLTRSRVDKGKVALRFVPEPPDGGEDLREGVPLGEHLAGPGLQEPLADLGVLRAGHHQHRDGGVRVV